MVGGLAEAQPKISKLCGSLVLGNALLCELQSVGLTEQQHCYERSQQLHGQTRLQSEPKGEAVGSSNLCLMLEMSKDNSDSKTNATNLT